MNVRVSCYVPILLLCVQLRHAASEPISKAFSNWVGLCFGSKAPEQEAVVTEGDFNVVVEYMNSPNIPVSAQEANSPSSAELAQIREIFKQDSKAENFMKYGSPSIREQIMHLAKTTPEVSRNLQMHVTDESQAVATNNVPMSRAVLEQAMRLSEEKIEDIETRTKHWRNELYAEKRIRLTADLFGSVCLGATEEALGTWITSPRPNPDFTREQKVLDPLEQEINKIIMPCGIFVDVDRGYLAAVPDGLVEKNAIVKLHVLNRPGLDPSKYNWKKGKDLAPDKPLYYEIQGLLAITRKELCYLIVVTRKSMRHVIVKRNEAFWQNMVDKLDNFYFNQLQHRISNNRLPDINNIRIAASVLHVLTTDNTNKRLREIFQMTQAGSFDTLKLESRIRLLAKDFHIIMDDTKLMKTKVWEILQNYYQSKEDWESERDSKIAFVRRYANKHNYDVELGGLIIDRTNRFLAALPSAIGQRKGKQSAKDTPTVLEEQLQQDIQNVQSVPAGQNGKNVRFSMFSRNNKGGKSMKPDPAPAPKKAPTRVFSRMPSLVGIKPAQEADKPETVIFEVVTPQELAAGKDTPDVDSVKKGTRNYYKIQGSLAISRAKTCIFIVAYPGRKETVVKVEFNRQAWAEMLEKLKHFYYSVYLIHHAAPKEFNRMFRGPSLKDAMGWPMGLFPDKNP